MCAGFPRHLHKIRCVPFLFLHRALADVFPQHYPGCLPLVIVSVAGGSPPQSSDVGFLLRDSFFSL